MIPAIRQRYNAAFTEERYAAFLADLNTAVYWPVDFRVAESPLFLDAETAQRLAQASADIVAQLATPQFRQHAATAVPAALTVPNETPFPHFLCIDFALCDDGEGRIEPQLIELQAFPTVAFFQALLTRTYPKHFGIPASFTSYFGGHDEGTYVAALRRAIVGDCEPAETVLLEITPDQQKTRVDFAATEKMLGVRPVDVSAVRKHGKKLFYDRDGTATPIKRIYNRVIFDELLRKKPAMDFSFFDELDVEYAGHPNWYFRISKHTLPFLKGRNIPYCRRLRASRRDRDAGRRSRRRALSDRGGLQPPRLGAPAQGSVCATAGHARRSRQGRGPAYPRGRRHQLAETHQQARPAQQGRHARRRLQQGPHLGRRQRRLPPARVRLTPLVFGRRNVLRYHLRPATDAQDIPVCNPLGYKPRVARIPPD